MTDELADKIIGQTDATAGTAPHTPAGVASKTEFRVGTLIYSKAGLMYLFAWLLWGDFCFSVMETVTPTVLPISLKSMGASNVVTGLLITTIPGLLNSTVCPIVSFKSDRMRTKWGRRIPILLFATPPLAIFLAAIGYSREIGGWLSHLLGSHLGNSQASIIFGSMGFAIIGFQFFNMFVGSVYYYLFNDVVPETHLARFMSLFRIVGSLAGALFNFFVLKYAVSHMREIFLGAAVLYTVAFMTMCFNVKEGKYPDPPPLIGNRKGGLAQFGTYFAECFTHKFYWYFFLSNAFFAAVNCILAFAVFLPLSLGLNLGLIGKINGIAGLVSTCLLYPAGIISDKYHPLRTMLVVSVGVVAISSIGLVWLFIPDPSYHLVLTITIVSNVLLLPFNTLLTAAALPSYMRLLPRERYGQFCSADAMVRSLMIIVGGYLAGQYLDMFKGIYHGNEFYYRWIPMWIVVCQSIGLFFLWKLFGSWKKLGADQSFVPPS